ncbi:MAG: hypothetical protein AB7T10_04875 [bacterium]
MKKLLTLFLVIGVLGLYGQTTEGEIQTEATTTQQVDTITLPDTIDVKELQIEDDTASSIKDSLFTGESKKDQKEIIEKKDSPISCCLNGKTQSEQKSKWNFGIGYVAEYNYAGPHLTADYLDRVEWFGELSLNQLLTLFNYWMNGAEMYIKCSKLNRLFLSNTTSYAYTERTNCAIMTDYVILDDSTLAANYNVYNIKKISSSFLFSKNNFVFGGPCIEITDVAGLETLYKRKDEQWQKDSTKVQRIGLGLGVAFRVIYNSMQVNNMKLPILWFGIRIGQTIEVWNNSPWKEVWCDSKLIVGFTGINFGLQLNWGK